MHESSYTQILFSYNILRETEIVKHIMIEINVTRNKKLKKNILVYKAHDKKKNFLANMEFLDKDSRYIRPLNSACF